MRSAKEYSPETSVFELVAFFYDQIVVGEIRTFSSLLQSTQEIPRTSQTVWAYAKAFHLIRRLYWGIFQDVTPKRYPRLWKALVIPDNDLKIGGDLKRNMTIVNLYVGFLDIHGYTDFCRKAGRNVSMLHLLDTCIHEDVQEIARENEVLSKRSMGDTIILIGATAGDLLKTTLSIVDYFSKRRLIQDDRISRHRPGDKIILPDMSVSAGIAGGRIYNPLIITDDGDISGGVINTAARLQVQANKIAPADTKIVVTKHVRVNFVRERSAGNGGDRVEDMVKFFDAGVVAFKGGSVSVSEVLFVDRDGYKISYQKQMRALGESVRKERWRDTVFLDLVNLLCEACRAMPGFRFKYTDFDNDSEAMVTNDRLVELCEKTRELFLAGREYPLAVHTLAGIVKFAQSVPGFDGVVLEYAESIVDGYLRISTKYTDRLEQLVHEKADTIFTLQDLKAFRVGRKYSDTYRSLIASAMSSAELGNRKSLWHRTIDTFADEFSVRIYSGKK